MSERFPGEERGACADRRRCSLAQSAWDLLPPLELCCVSLDRVCFQLHLCRQKPPLLLSGFLGQGPSNGQSALRSEPSVQSFLSDFHKGLILADPTCVPNMVYFSYFIEDRKYDQSENGHLESFAGSTFGCPKWKSVFRS